MANLDVVDTEKSSLMSCLSLRLSECWMEASPLALHPFGSLIELLSTSLPHEARRLAGDGLKVCSKKHLVPSGLHQLSGWLAGAASL